MADKVNFQRFGNELWQIANVFRDDILKTTEYLEEFSYFLFLKMLDDREKADQEIAEAEGKEYQNLIPEKYRFYAWAKAHHPKGLLPFVRQMFDELAGIPDEGGRDRSLIRKLFGNHILRVRYEPTLRDLVNRLLELEFESASYDVLGRAYEFVVQKLGEQGQYGQYFTPRHIVDFMVKLIDPKPGEKIYDPAAGTSGFLVWAFGHVIKSSIEEEPDAVRKEEMIRKLKFENLHGVEKAPDVYKLGLMNMILHGDGNANLVEDDSLSPRAQDLRKGKYDVILTNPPFGPKAQTRTAIFEYHARSYEALFIQHMMNALAPGGRCATVMKEGLLFSNSPQALQKIRRKLVERFNLQAVISLPSGVFFPYTGSKTSILVFERPEGHSGGTTEKVWFYRVEADGFELSQVRRPTEENDLPDALGKWPKREESEKSWTTTVEEIRKNDYNLTASRYTPYRAETREYEAPDVLIDQVAELEGEIADGLRGLKAMLGKERSDE